MSNLKIVRVDVEIETVGEGRFCSTECPFFQRLQAKEKKPKKLLARCKIFGDLKVVRSPWRHKECLQSEIDS